MAEDNSQLSNRDLMLEMHGDIKKLIAAQASTDAKVEGVGLRLAEHVADDKTKHDDVDKRLNSHDNWRSRMMGYGAAIAFVVGIVVSFAKEAVAAVMHLR